MCGASEPFGAGLNSNGGASAASSRRSGVPGPAAAEAWRRMESEPSRIPVYGALHRGGPAEMQMVFPSKKQCVSKAADLEFSKDPNFNFSSSIPGDGVFKATNQGFPKSAKKTEPVSKKTAARGPLSRYKLEAELKTKNQLLETAKQQLHSRLAGAQGTIKELREENEGLAQEVEKLKKFQETCMVILESRNIDPVTGSNILEEEEKTKECRKQTTLLTEKLIAELRLFNETAAKEKEVLQTAMAKWKSAEEERHQSLEKHSSFQAEMEQCSAMLDQLELLLAM